MDYADNRARGGAIAQKGVRQSLSNICGKSNLKPFLLL